MHRLVIYIHYSCTEAENKRLLYNVSATHMHDATLKVHSIHSLILCQKTPKDLMQAIIHTFLLCTCIMYVFAAWLTVSLEVYMHIALDLHHSVHHCLI